MAKWISKSGELELKVAIIGQPDSGKKDIIKGVAEQYDQSVPSSVPVSDAEVINVEFIWPEPLLDGPFVRVRLQGVSGKPLHQAADQLVLSDCDALVFVVSCDPDRQLGCKAALSDLMSNAATTGLDWGETPLVLQYNKAEHYPAITPEDLDSCLGVNLERVQRYHTKSDCPDQQGLAVIAAIKAVVTKMSDRHLEKNEASS